MPVSFIVVRSHGGLYIAVVAAFQDAGQLLLCLGLKFQGLLPALAVALGLTALVFMGPLAMEAIDWGSPQHVSQARSLSKNVSV